MEPQLTPYEFQVGGHSHDRDAGEPPPSLRDEQGRFLKRLQHGERGAREAAFYAAMEATRQQPESQQAPGVAALAEFVPRSYGLRTVGGESYLVLQDATAGLTAPCVLDVKLGFTTAYPWAPAQEAAKYAAKDAATSQAACGFRLCGVLLHRAHGGVWREDRHWGKALTAASVGRALARFADNGHLSLAQLAVGPGMLLEQLRRLAGAFEVQGSWHCYSASVLLLYEGAATRPQDAAPAVRLIDFAHTFATGCAAAGSRCSGRDENLLAGLNSLISMIEAQAAVLAAPAAETS